MRSLWPVRAAFFMVQTTLPMTRPSSMLFFPRSCEFGLMQRVELHFIDDADDRGVHGTVLAFGGQARGAARNHQDSLAESGIDRIHSDQIAGFVRAFGGNWFYDEEFLAFE